jgi:hypothetical protein
LGITSPDYEYLEKVKNINREDFKNKLLRKVDEINLSELACDVQPFLINPDEIERVLSFREFIEQKL